jgi:imidazolonepropionase-like amidohydrolase
VIAIRARQVVDGRGGPALRDPVILVQGPRILALGAKVDVDIPAGADLVDLPEATVLPGLIDTHVHLSAFNTTTFQNYRAAKLEVPPSYRCSTPLSTLSSASSADSPPSGISVG